MWPIGKRIRMLTALVLAVLLLGGCSLSMEEQPTETTPPPETEPPVPPNPYDAEDFMTDGETMECIAGETRFGIDVSYWQGDIDWQQVKDSGVSFVMIRVGWRGSEQGILSPDKKAQEYYAGARAVGLDVGCYLFSQAISVEEAVEEAEFLLEQIRDWELSMPVAYDWEYISADSRTAHVDARLLTDCTKAFCDRVREAGHTPMVYFNVNQSHKKLYLEELTDYGFWLAMYDAPMNYPHRVDMWQYSNTGTVPGIEADVDLNLYFIYE